MPSRLITPDEQAAVQEEEERDGTDLLILGTVSRQSEPPPADESRGDDRPLGRYAGELEIQTRLHLDPTREVAENGLTLSDDEIAAFLALIGLGLDQSAVVAAHFCSVPPGSHNHNAWSMRAPFPRNLQNKEWHARTQRAFTDFTMEVGWPSSISPHPTGIIIDIHTFDNATVPTGELVLLTYDWHLAPVIGEGILDPRHRQQWLLDGMAAYSAPIRRAVDRCLEPLIAELEAAASERAATLSTPTGEPDIYQDTLRRLKQIKTARSELDAGEIDANLLSDVLARIHAAIQAYTFTGKLNVAGELEPRDRLAELRTGFEGIRATARERDAALAEWVEEVRPIIEQAEREHMRRRDPNQH
jgi:hypothetical protein